jgi:hypothetical protein
VKIIAFELDGHLALDVVFEDTSRLKIRFVADRLRGAAARLDDPEEFCRANLSRGTVVWPCGVAVDSQVARIKADEAPVWTLI